MSMDCEVSVIIWAKSVPVLSTVSSYGVRVDLPCYHRPKGFLSKILFAYPVSPIESHVQSIVHFLDVTTLAKLGKYECFSFYNTLLSWLSSALPTKCVCACVCVCVCVCHNIHHEGDGDSLLNFRKSTPYRCSRLPGMIPLKHNLQQNVKLSSMCLVFLTFLKTVCRWKHQYFNRGISQTQERKKENSKLKCHNEMRLLDFDILRTVHRDTFV